MADDRDGLDVGDVEVLDPGSGVEYKVGMAVLPGTVALVGTLTWGSSCYS